MNKDFKQGFQDAIPSWYALGQIAASGAVVFVCAVLFVAYIVTLYHFLASR